MSLSCKGICLELDRAFSSTQSKVHFPPTGSCEDPALSNTVHKDLDNFCVSIVERTSRQYQVSKRLKYISLSARGLCSQALTLADAPYLPFSEINVVSPLPRSKGTEDESTILELSTTTPTPRQRKRVLKVSPYFEKSPSKKPNPTDRVSCVPFPRLSATSFGLMQERLAHDPFRLLVACIFLNKTRGAVALPVFYELIDRYPTPADLAEAEQEDVVEIIQHLGLQNQRAKKCINLAKAWCERPPEKAKRYRLLHYPKHGDGKDIKPGEILDEADERVAWEVGQLPGIGAYAIDSWRIFCRDGLRGLPHGLPARVTEESKDAEMQKEWARVLPVDKELRAYLRWRWLRNGWAWDPLTGERGPADEGEMRDAEDGGVFREANEGDDVLARDVRKEVDG